MELAAVALAVAMNRADYRAVLLSLIVGLSIAAPINPEGFTAGGWYFMLASIEIAVVVSAVVLWCSASPFVVMCHLILCIMHVIQFYTAPYADELSVYPIFVPFMEWASLFYLCFTSKTFFRGYHGNMVY